MALETGRQAPDFTLPSSSGYDFTLSVDMKDRPCIIYFYPKDYTPGCTTEACDFRDVFEELESAGVDVVGISRDSVNTHQRFINDLSLQFQLLSDIDGKVAEEYKALIPFMRITKRVTYLLDRDHKIVASYENLLGAKKHARKMMESLKTQSSHP